MKKKFVILLVLVLAVSVSLNPFAATNNFIENRLLVPDKTVLFENALVSDFIELGCKLTDKTYNSNEAGGIAKWYSDGTDLIIPIQNDVQEGYSIKLALGNAIWFFRANAADSTVEDTLSKLSLPYDSSQIIATKDFPAYISPAPIMSTYNTANGVYIPSVPDLLGVQSYSLSGSGVYYRNIDENTQPLFITSLQYTNGTPYYEARYMLQVSPLDSSVAIVTILDDISVAQNNYYLRIPLVTYIQDSEEVTVSIDAGNTSGVANQKLIFAAGYIYANVYSIASGTDYFSLSKLTISELEKDAICSGEAIRLSLPDGYHFDKNFGSDNNDIQVGTDKGLAWGDGTNGLGTYVTSDSALVLSGNQYTLLFDNNNDSVLWIDLGELNTYSQDKGSIYINNLKIWADDSTSAPEGTDTIPIMMNISGKTYSITTRNVLVAIREAEEVSENRPTNTPTPTNEPEPTDTPTPTHTLSPTATQTPTPTNTPAYVPWPYSSYYSSSPTYSSSSTRTPTPTYTPTPTNTPAPIQLSSFSQEVRVPIGKDYYLVNGVSFKMDAISYISPASNSTMVPLRFIANAFGFRDDQIMWDNATKTATIATPDRIIKFTLNKSEMVINGVPLTMKSPDGLPVAAEIKTINGLGRIYLPFRALGQAFDIPVDWDAGSITAIYNKK